MTRPDPITVVNGATNSLRDEARAYRAFPAVFILAAAAIQVGVVAVGRIHWNSDEALISIMAWDILRGIHPAFCYGSAYGGTLEPHWLAAVFAVFGSSVLSFRLAMIALLCLFLYCTYRVAALYFKPAVAALALGYLAVPPWFFLYKGLTSDGAYTTILVLGSIMLFAAMRLEACLRRGDKRLLWMAALGLVAGAAWWVHPLSVYFFAAIAVWFAIVHPSAFGRFRLYPLFTAAFLVGGFPWWVSNIRHSWKSLHAPEIAPVSLSEYVGQFGSFWKLGLPVLLASRPVFNESESYLGETLLSAFLFLAPAAIAAIFVWRQRKTLRRSLEGAAAQSRVLLLLLLVLVFVPLIASTIKRAHFSEPRFLFPILTAYPVVFGFAVWWLWGRSWSPRVLAAAILGAALFSSGRGLLDPAPYRRHLDRTNNGSLVDLIQELDRRGIRSVYASYWVAYRLAFESNEAIIGTPFGEHRTQRVDRYRRQADADPRPAFVLSGAEGAQLAGFLNPRNVDYREFSVGPFRVFYDVDRTALAHLRATLQIPAPAS